MNVSSTSWCAPWGIGGKPHGNYENCGAGSEVDPDTHIPAITANMIDLMMEDRASHTLGVDNGDNLFEDPRPAASSFSLLPGYTHVSYNACSTGYIEFTPCGVNMKDGYRVDRGFTYDHYERVDSHNNSAIADIDLACTDYHGGLKASRDQDAYVERGSAVGGTQPTLASPIGLAASKARDLGMTIFPNPSNGKFMLQFEDADQEAATRSVSIFTPLGELAYQTVTGNPQLSVDLSGRAQGVYFVTVQAGNNFHHGNILIR